MSFRDVSREIPRDRNENYRTRTPQIFARGTIRKKIIPVRGPFTRTGNLTFLCFFVLSSCLQYVIQTFYVLTDHVILQIVVIHIFRYKRNELLTA